VTIVGIFDSGVADFDRSVAYLPMQTFQDVFFMRGAGHAVVVSLPELGQVDDAVAQLQPIAAERGLVVHDWDALQPGLKQAIQADISSAFFMYFILVILVAFSVLNTQLMSVLERTREFGIVMALGVSGGRMVRLIFLETTLLGAGGTLLGIAGGALLTGWFQINGFSFPGMDEMAQQFNLPARVFPSVGVLSLTIGPVAVLLFCLLAAIYPAFRLYRLQPVAAMRAA
jgi:putative ABC transport system permease protein